MCGRFALGVPKKQVEEAFGQTLPEGFEPRFNIAPGTLVPALAPGPEGEAAFSLFRWGLAPSWAKDESPGARMINARAETAPDKPAFRSAFKSRRCLIPAQGFYEWKDGPGGKQPFFIARQDGGLLALAGLWEEWSGPDGLREGGPLPTLAILTTDACREVREIHHRMPVIVAPRDRTAWLDPETDPETLRTLTAPPDSCALASHPVSRRVGRPDFDSPECIRPVERPVEPGASEQGSLPGL